MARRRSLSFSSSFSEEGVCEEEEENEDGDGLAVTKARAAEWSCIVLMS